MLPCQKTCNDSANNTYKYLTSLHECRNHFTSVTYGSDCFQIGFFSRGKSHFNNANTTKPYRFAIFLGARDSPFSARECQLPRISSHATNAQFTRLVIYICIYIFQAGAVQRGPHIYIYINCCVCARARECIDGRQMFLMNARRWLSILPFVSQLNRVRVRMERAGRRHTRKAVGGEESNIFLGFI